MQKRLKKYALIVLSLVLFRATASAPAVDLNPQLAVYVKARAAGGDHTD